MRNDNGRFFLAWESTTTRLDAGFDFRQEAEDYAATFKDRPAILNVVLFDRQDGSFAVLKGKMPANYAKAIPVRSNVTVTRAEMLMLERVLARVVEGEWEDAGDPEAASLLAKVKAARTDLEQDQNRQRALNAAAAK